MNCRYFRLISKLLSSATTVASVLIAIVDTRNDCMYLVEFLLFTFYWNLPFTSIASRHPRRSIRYQVKLFFRQFLIVHHSFPRRLESFLGTAPNLCHIGCKPSSKRCHVNVQDIRDRLVTLHLLLPTLTTRASINSKTFLGFPLRTKEM